MSQLGRDVFRLGNFDVFCTCFWTGKRGKRTEKKDDGTEKKDDGKVIAPEDEQSAAQSFPFGCPHLTVTG